MDQDAAKKQLLASWEKLSRTLTEESENLVSAEKADVFQDVFIKVIDEMQKTLHESYQLMRDARPTK